MRDVYNFIASLNINNENIVIALSGGPDSMALLEILLSLKEKLNINIIVAHINHNVRKESKEEANEIKKLCEDKNLIFEFMKIENYPNNKFTEEYAREKRYEFFDKIVSKYNAKILFTAHHADDLIETILMRLTRGSNIKGYAGFERLSMDRGYKIAKPLIFVTKDEIIKYLNKKGVKYFLDMSNESDKYTRNRYRKYVLKALKDENKNVHNKFVEYNEKLLLADNFIKEELNKVYSNIVDSDIDTIKFKSLYPILKVYLLERYLNDVYKNNIKDINYTHINIIKSVIEKNINCVIDLPNNKKGILEYNKFKIIEYKEIGDYNYIFNDSITLLNGKTIKIDNNTDLTSNYVIHLNSNEIKLPFHVRNMKKGDKMKVKNMNGTKKVSDIFTDCKIEKELRKSYPIVTDDNDVIIWIPGIKKSNFDRKKDEKYDIILKYN